MASNIIEHKLKTNNIFCLKNCPCTNCDHKSFFWSLMCPDCIILPIHVDGTNKTKEEFVSQMLKDKDIKKKYDEMFNK